MRRGGVVDGEAVGEVVAGDHDARVEAREDRGHDEEGAGRREHESPAAAGEPDTDDGAEQCGDREQRGQQRREDVLVVAVDRDRDGPDQEPRADDGRRDREPTCGRRGAPAQLAGRAQRQIGRAVEREQQHDRDPAEQRVQVEEVPEGAVEVAAGVDRHAVEQVRERDTPDQGGAEAADRVRPGPDAEPARVLVPLAPLEREHADDQEHEQQQQGDVEAGEHRRVPGREGREHRAAGDHEPDLVAVPDGADRAEHRAALLLVARQERQQQPDAEVEALEHEVGGEEEADQAEPEEW